MDLIFATNNQHKADEINSILPSRFCIKTLKEAGIDKELEEPHQTLQENAAEKARTIYRLTNANCFSEDTGLEVYSLNNEPGVRSARYAGEDRSSEQNTILLLANLEGSENREARFRTVVCLILDGKEFYFEGICEGQIMKQRRGEKGFGYDPVFTPLGSDKTFAEMSMEEKNSFSHRRKAIDRLVAFLNQV
jgi:XTP/dITP diphosphohydrolase